MSGVEKTENISIRGARVNNLKNISIDIPENAFICVTGVSGCGKSSLVYDTIFAESQRNFLESMSGNMFGQKLMNKPDVDEIVNLHPALDVSQNYYNNNPRSTVGTLTDISYYLRTLFALIKTFENGKIYLERFFSSNNPSSCCEKCHGLGEEFAISEKLLIPDESKTLKAGAILYYKGKENSLENRMLEAICQRYGIDINAQFRKLSKKEKEILLYRKNDEIFELKYKTPKGRYKQKKVICNGAMAELEEKILDIDVPSVFASISKYLIKVECSECSGAKIKEKVRNERVCGKNISEVETLKLKLLVDWLTEVEDKYRKREIYNQVNQLVSQITIRTKSMIDLKLEHLSIDRSVPTLSGGEIQRIRISSQLTCPLRGLIYVLDEPCKGLHPRNVECIVAASKGLVSKGNTVLAIEHNDRYICEADRVIELGPVGGSNGGYIIDDDKKVSLRKCIIQKDKEIKAKDWLSFTGIDFHNIHDESVKVPLGKITCVSGISGSGKSSLVSVIGTSVEKGKPENCSKADGLNKIKKVIYVNQKPIGKTPRSTVVSYLEIYDLIRILYAKENKAKEFGFTATDFSMNVAGGRCEVCQGTGLQKIELNYLPDSFVVCPKCNGKRFKDDILSVDYKGYSIGELLDEPIENIIELFSEYEEIYSKLHCVIEIGLGYIKLGQRSMNLSGGEAQRIKLAKALGQSKSGKYLYILDEPTSGLSNVDREKLKNILLSIGNNGDTIIMIEHNMEFIQQVSDYLIDFGVLAGDEGGTIFAEGTPYEVFMNKKSSWYGI